MNTLYAILLDFLPILVAFWLKPAPVGSAIACLITGVVVYRQMRRKRLKTISIVTGLFFTFSLLFTIFYPQIQLMPFSSLIIYTILSITTLISLFIHEPFTYQYAKENVDPVLWEHPLFISINVKLTIVWAVMFLLSTLFASLSANHILYGWLGMFLTHLWNLLGILASLLWPPIAQRQYSTKRKRNMYLETTWDPTIFPEPPQEKDTYDVIIIGSGIGGLTAAVELAAVGAKVLVLEQHHLFGGACTTYPRKMGFRFDAGVESISGLGLQGPVCHFLMRHSLHEKLTWLRNTYQFNYGHESFTIPHDVNAWRDLLQARFPNEAKGIENLFKELKAAYHEMYDSFAPDRITPWIPESREELLAYPSLHSHYFRWMDKKWKDLLDAFVHEPLLRKQLSMLTYYVGDLEENTAANSMIALFGYYLEGGYRPVGGTGVLAQRMVERLQQYGGEARSSLKVESILLQNGEVKGVRTANGSLNAAVVISNVDPRVTYESLVGLEHLQTNFQKKIQDLEPTMSLFVWTAAIDRPFFTNRLISYVLPDPIYLSSLGVKVDKVGIHSASALDPSLAPKGKGTLTIFIPTKAEASKFSHMSSEDYTVSKQEIDSICRKIVQQIDPEAERSILFSEVATPKTMQKYLQTYEGSVYSIRQRGGFPEMKTPLRGLYLAGAGVGYGPGIEAVVISGGQVAEHLKPFFAHRNQVASMVRRA